MRCVLVIPALLATCLAVPVFDSSLDSDWEAFKVAYKKTYDSLEENVRRAVWEDHRGHIERHNKQYDAGVHTYYLGDNEYADMSSDEFVSVMNGLKMSNKTTLNLLPTLFGARVPSSIDWRQQGIVTGVKNQGRCGSCWAFSTTGGLEGQHARHSKQLVSLSEQNLVDCSKQNAGCRGGLMDKAYQYIQQNGGIDTEASYPYTGRDGSCHFSRSSIGATDKGVYDVRRGSESSLMNAVATYGPISVGIDASHRSFQLYRGGIYNERACSSSRLDHGVLAVGYGPGYWLVKNSWGTGWGERGYIRMSKDKNNQCGIATGASVPRV